MDQHIVIPIALFACVTYAFRAVLDAILRERLLRLGVTQELVQAIVRGEERQRRNAALRGGLVFVLLALGFALIQGIGWNELNAGAVGILAAAIGLAQLGYFILSRRMDL